MRSHSLGHIVVRNILEQIIYIIVVGFEVRHKDAIDIVFVQA